jgi:hypothetical protein
MALRGPRDEPALASKRIRRIPLALAEFVDASGVHIPREAFVETIGVPTTSSVSQEPHHSERTTESVSTNGGQVPPKKRALQERKALETQCVACDTIFKATARSRQAEHPKVDFL